jgi:ADP-ribose pyrophosphatase
VIVILKIDDDELKWSSVEERVVFRSHFVGFRNDRAKRPDGKIVDYIVLENRDYSAVICKNSQGEFLLVRQFRYPWMQASWETPSGLLEPNESPTEAAIREVLEETGYVVSNIEKMLKCHPSGMGPGYCHLFYADVEEGGKQSLDSTEFIQVGTFSSDEISKMIDDSQIIHMTTVLGWIMAKSKGFV